MSDAPRSCALEYAKQVVISEPELRYASKILERKPIVTCEIPYPLIKEWHKFISEKTLNAQEVQVSASASSGSSGCTVHAIDYALFLEGTIKGNVLCFTDDKAKRHEINQTLSKIAGFVANLYKTTRGRAKGALDGKVRKFHIFEEQIKSSQEIQSEMMRLQRQADEWKRKYKDIEQEKKDLWQQMTQIINERDKAVSHLQNTNKELENYMATLEKLSGIQAEYKGKPVYCCQNKGRTF